MYPEKGIIYKKVKSTNQAKHWEKYRMLKNTVATRIAEAKVMHDSKLETKMNESVRQMINCGGNL